MLRIFGQQKFYLKNANVIERMANISTIIFDKTGTITSNNKAEIFYEGKDLSKEESILLYNLLRASNHPLSRQLYDSLSEEKVIEFDNFEEITGKGIKAIFNGKKIKVGSASFINYKGEVDVFQTSVYLQIEEEYIGRYVFQNTYRKGLDAVFESLGSFSKLAILSGDNEGEKIRLEKLLPKGTQFLFQKDPQQKLEYVKQLLQYGERVMMIGDGLNDAGALAQSDVGIVVSENINVFSPACDGILDATKFSDFPKYVSASKKSIKIIKWSFVFSFLYNITGLYFAVSGNLMPVIAAILMPLSSISIVIFTTIATSYVGNMLRKT
jgi:Cu+-exporting ATPase